MKRKHRLLLNLSISKKIKKDFEKALDKLSNEAIQQIKDRKYDYNLKGKVIKKNEIVKNIQKIQC